MGDDFLPFDVVEAAVTAVGTAFYYKDPLGRFLRRCGVPASLFQRFETESKFKIARHIFAELEEKGAACKAVAVQIVQQLCALRTFPDGVDERSAKAALERLRNVARSAQLETARESIEREERSKRQAQKVEARTQRERELTELRTEFFSLLSESDTQKRGYALESLLRRLFQANEIDFRPSYRTDSEQIDGAFVHNSFDYLAETRWRREQATLAALDTFRAKVERKLESTRGLFISINGFDEAIVDQFERGKRNVILMDGEDLTLILEGRISLPDALDLKARQGAQHGRLFVRLRDHLMR